MVRAQSGSRQKVLLWPDTFNNHFRSETAQAATEVLEALGFEVILPAKQLCCGRPLYDYGMLDAAQRYLERILRVMRPHLAAGTPIVVLEPSCASVFRDELPNLLPKREDGKRLTSQTLVLSEFLTKYAPERLPRLERNAIVQAHCHHKSVLGFEAQKKVFELMGLSVTQPASGCCGLAGSFGFEAEKYPISVDCGERVIFPAVRGADDGTLILADGFSCRTQIEHGTARHALHLAEVLKLALFPAGNGKPARYPEASLVRQRKTAVARSMYRARVAVWAGLIGAAGVATLLLARRKSTR